MPKNHKTQKPSGHSVLCPKIIKHRNHQGTARCAPTSDNSLGMARHAPTKRMEFNPDIHHRRSIRLKDYDYSLAGAYFVTVCVQGYECVLGKVIDGEMRLNEYGVVVENEWLKTGESRPEIILDEYVVMPNHFHGIIVIIDEHNNVNKCRGTACRAQKNNMKNPGMARHAPTFGKPTAGSLPTIVGAFKSAVTKQINKIWKISGTSLWQRNYYEHIIRNEKSLNKIREYILTNPLRWELDRNNPHCTGIDEFDRWLDTFRKPTKKM